MNDAHKAFEAAQRTGEVISVVLETRHSGVQIPESLRKDKRCVLNFGYKKGLSCKTTQYGIQEQLRFDGRWMLCFIPWEAVKVIYVEAIGGLFYREMDVPVREIMATDGNAAQAVREPLDNSSAGEPTKCVRTRNGRELLRVYEGGGEGDGVSKATLRLVGPEND